MKKKIITDINYLKQKSEEVSLQEATDIIADLEDTLKGRRGIGLSAIQIGVSKRVAIIRIGNQKIDLINPIITERSGKFRFIKEGCLSIPGLYLNTTRYKDITVENNGELFAVYGMESVAIQHETDHMDGILMINRKWKKRR